MALGRQGRLPLLLLLLAGCAGGAEGFGRLFKSLLSGNSSTTQAHASSGCGDSQVECKDWAAGGECEANPGFMHEACARSCGKCEGYRKVQRRRGCEDDPAYDCRARMARSECDTDKGEMLIRCPMSCGACRFINLVREALDCNDVHENCPQWARSGECQANPNYMRENCPVVCNECKQKRLSCNRPPNTPPSVGKGDINVTMMRILRDFPQYQPKAISWPGGPKGAKAPWVVTLQNFVQDDEVEAFKSTCEHHFDRSLAGDQLSPVRTSSQCWCSGNACEAHPLTTRVADRIANVTRTQKRYMEPFQILKYEPGQFYKVHHDQNSGLFTPQGPRVYTFFMYLSTPEKGGGTRFPDLGVTVPAVKGSAVLWPSVTNLDPNRDEPLTNHEALPTTIGRKFASNVWIHQYDFRSPAAANCLLTHKNTH